MGCWEAIKLNIDLELGCTNPKQSATLVFLRSIKDTWAKIKSCQNFSYLSVYSKPQRSKIRKLFLNFFILVQSSSDVIRLNSSSFKKVFVEIEEEMIRTGFTEDDLGKASLLQLFYLVFLILSILCYHNMANYFKLGMKQTISLNYEILGTDSDELQLERPWLSFRLLCRLSIENTMTWYDNWMEWNYRMTYVEIRSIPFITWQK